MKNKFKKYAAIFLTICIWSSASYAIAKHMLIEDLDMNKHGCISHTSSLACDI